MESKDPYPLHYFFFFGSSFLRRSLLRHSLLLRRRGMRFLSFRLVLLFTGAIFFTLGTFFSSSGALKLCPSYAISVMRTAVYP